MISSKNLEDPKDFTYKWYLKISSIVKIYAKCKNLPKIDLKFKLVWNWLVTESWLQVRRRGGECTIWKVILNKFENISGLNYRRLKNSNFDFFFFFFLHAKDADAPKIPNIVLKKNILIKYITADRLILIIS